jgi:hypothetical protein
VVKNSKNTEGVNKIECEEKCRFDEKKKKKKTAGNTALPPTRRQKPTHERLNGGGYAAVQTFAETKNKKSVLRLNKRKKIKKQIKLKK